MRKKTVFVLGACLLFLVLTIIKMSPAGVAEQDQTLPEEIQAIEQEVQSLEELAGLLEQEPEKKEKLGQVALDFIEGVDTGLRVLEEFSPEKEKSNYKKEVIRTVLQTAEPEEFASFVEKMGVANPEVVLFIQSQYYQVKERYEGLKDRAEYYDISGEITDHTEDYLLLWGQVGSAEDEIQQENEDPEDQKLNLLVLDYNSENKENSHYSGSDYYYAGQTEAQDQAGKEVMVWVFRPESDELALWESRLENMKQEAAEMEIILE